MYTHTHPSLPILKYLYPEGARLSPTFLLFFSFIKTLLCVPQKLSIQLKYFPMSKFLLGPSMVGFFRLCIPLYNMIFYSISEFITLLLNMCSYISLSRSTHTHTHIQDNPRNSNIMSILCQFFKLRQKKKGIIKEEHTHWRDHRLHVCYGLQCVSPKFMY